MNKEETDLQIQAGPCVVCGEQDYPLSMGGPTICPACDCGTDLKTRLTEFREQVKLLKGYIQTALDELGVPNEGYPAPVSNAVNLLKEALKE